MAGSPCRLFQTSRKSPLDNFLFVTTVHRLSTVDNILETMTVYSISSFIIFEKYAIIRQINKFSVRWNFRE